MDTHSAVAFQGAPDGLWRTYRGSQQVQRIIGV